jgi:GNAT superfamily N-acetyltransferase
VPAVPDAELERRVRAGLPAELELFGSSSPTARVLRLGGVIASVSPATPDRSLFNSVYAEDPAEIEGRLDELEHTYEDAGVEAWTVWIPAGHRLGAEVLADRGHELDGAPRSMGLALDEFRPPARELPAGVEIRPGTMLETGPVNDAAYGLDRVWETALAGEPTIEVHWAVAVEDGRPVACAGAVDVGADACITGVATLPDRQGLGLASLLIARLIDDARDRGLETATLQASRAGAPVYAKLGFRDVGNTEMWEKRKGRSGAMPFH